MKKVLLTVAAGAVALSSAVLPAGAADKKATTTEVITNGVASGKAANPDLVFGGPGKAILKKKVDGKWVVKHTEDIKFESNLAMWEGKLLDKSGHCKVIAKYLGNAKYAPSTSKGWPIDCKTGAYNGEPA